jgi:hypothetical protein
MPARALSTEEERPMNEKTLPQPICIGCNKKPAELDEYVECADDEGCTPDEYVRSEEGTFNRENGHFLCTDCYIKAGMPASPTGWIAP